MLCLCFQTLCGYAFVSVSLTPSLCYVAVSIRLYLALGFLRCLACWLSHPPWAGGFALVPSPRFSSHPGGTTAPTGLSNPTPGTCGDGTVLSRERPWGCRGSGGRGAEAAHAALASPGTGRVSLRVPARAFPRAVCQARPAAPGLRFIFASGARGLPHPAFSWGCLQGKRGGQAL